MDDARIDSPDWGDPDGRLSVRPMQSDDRRASDEAPTNQTDSSDRTNPARVQSVRGIRARFSRVAGRTYVYIHIRDRVVPLGRFDDDGLARHVAAEAVAAIADVIPESPEEILEAFICDIEQEIPVDHRRAFGGMRHGDPIAAAVNRIGVQPTQGQIARLYGVCHKRIYEVETSARARYARAMGGHA